MGVRGLTSYIENYCPNACYKVSIKDLLLQYKAESTDLPVIVIDGMSLLRPLLGKSSWLNGGQMKELKEVIGTFIHKFTDMQCKLVLYFDGPLQEEKISTWRQRRFTSAKEISMVFEGLDQGVPVSQLETGNSSRAVLPNGFGYLLLIVIEGNPNVKYVTSIKECDMEIADYAFRNKCLAIISHDSDYIILQGAKYYLSGQHLNLEDMTTMCYDSLAFARDLGLESDELPLLATLLGNDIVEYKLLQSFQHHLTKKYKGYRGTRTFSYVYKVAQFIKDLPKPCNLSQISSYVFNTNKYASLLKTSLESYDITKFDILSAKRDVFTSDRNWNKVIEHLFSEPYFGPLYDIILNFRFTSSVCLEDYRPDSEITPCGKVFGNLRKYWYGILLDEKKPCLVRELVFTDTSDLNFVNVKPYFLETKHPGLLSLWTDESDAMRTIKLCMLEEIFKIQASKLMALPLRLAIPALTLKYLSNEKMDIHEWELDALIATNVCVQCFSINELKALPEILVSKRSIMLYTTVTRGFSIVRNILLSMKDIFLFSEVSVEKFTDGKLFHFMFSKFKCDNSISSSFCKKKECLELFCSMRSFLQNT